MTARQIDGVAAAQALVGEHLGYSDFVEVSQDMVDRFADATGDHQWIHVDVERARRESPFGATIAHGYLTLSLGPSLYPQVAEFSGFSMAVNYGSNRVRFVSPVVVGSSLRLGVRLLQVDEFDGGAQMTMEFTFEVDGAPKPACVAEIIFRAYL